MKVYVIMQFPENRDPKIHSIYVKEEKAQERANNLRRQFPEIIHCVLKKTLLGRLRMKHKKIIPA